MSCGNSRLDAGGRRGYDTADEAISSFLAMAATADSCTFNMLFMSLAMSSKDFKAASGNSAVCKGRECVQKQTLQATLIVELCVRGILHMPQ